MAFSFRAGTNWCHDFPKLARESGFYFNSHRTHVRVDWNRISTIDIERVIRERDFFTIDDNINNVVDYHLETEYDVKILDPNFVKIFRLAQLSVEYLLYCKQYLDHSVIILKDELRSKLEENVKLKKLLSTNEINMREMKEKFRDKYKFIEKRFSDSHGEIHKCPFCPKTFIADVFMNSHITRRHSNASQLSVASPVHQQYKAEAEKLHDEIKTLKERLNETERVIRCESVKLCDSIELSKERNNDRINGELERNTNTTDKRLEEEHKKYREEMNQLTTMLFSEIRSLKQEDKRSINENESGNENFKELLKQQENEIHRLRDQLRQLSTKKLTPDLDIIQEKLNAQEDYWQLKIQQLESQHRNDIETLYAQLKMTQASTDFIKADYMNKMNELEKSRSDEMKLSANFQSSIKELKRSTDQSRVNKSEYHHVETTNRKIHADDLINSAIDRSGSDEILIEDVDKISETDMINTTAPVSKLNRITVSTIDSVNKSAVSYIKKDIGHKNIYTLKPMRDNFQKLSNQRNEVNGNRLEGRIRNAPHKNDAEQNIDRINHRENATDVTRVNTMDVSSSESDESESQSESTSDSKISQLNESNRLDGDNNRTSTEEETTEVSEDNKQIQINQRVKSTEELKKELEDILDQKLRDLGVDPEWHQIPTATYRQLIETVRYHRSINSKKYSKFLNIRGKIVKQLAEKALAYQKNNESFSVGGKEKKSSLNKLITNVKSRTFKTLGIQEDGGAHTPKLKSQIGLSHDKSVTNKFNIELLPKKIKQMEFREIQSPLMRQSQSQKSRIDREDNVALSSSTNDRYTSSPSRLNTKSMESIDMKHLSHSYESIKDYMKDSTYSYRKINSPLNISGPITTSTPQRDYINILPSQKSMTAEVSSQVPNSQEFISSLNSPKNNKSVLKSTTGPTGSLVKKKVLFDLQTIENSSDKIIPPRDLYTDRLDEMNNQVSESGSDFEISNISEEKSSELPVNNPTNSDNIVLRTAQSEKIAEISRKIETQLSSIRHKPLGGIEAMFTQGYHVENEKHFNGQSADKFMNVIKDNTIDLGVTTTPVTKLPQPTPRTPKPTYYTISPDNKSDTKDSNLDMDIEELLRED